MSSSDDIIKASIKQQLINNNSKYQGIIDDLNKYSKKISDDIDSWNKIKNKYMSNCALINNINSKNKFEGVSAEYFDDKFPNAIESLNSIFSKAKDLITDISIQIGKLEAKIKSNQTEITKLDSSN